MIGGPSAWSSDEPAVGPLAVHNHPLPMSVRIVLVSYGVMLGVTFGAIGWLVYSGQQADDAARDKIRTDVEHDLKVAQDKSAARDAATNEKTRRIVCIVIKESFTPTANTRALAHQLGCDVPTPHPSPGVSPAPPGAPSSGAAAAPNGPGPTSGPAGPSPRPTRTRRPTPKPSPTCTARVGSVCVNIPPAGRNVSGVSPTLLEEHNGLRPPASGPGPSVEDRRPR